jgi:hypothetical protein
VLDPARHSLSGLFGDLELYGSLGLLLHDDGPSGHAISVRDVSDAQLHEITGPELTVDGEVEHGELSGAFPKLKANADGPDILEAQRRLLTNELALVPRFALGRGSNRLVHDGGTPMMVRPPSVFYLHTADCHPSWPTGPTVLQPHCESVIYTLH